MPLLDLSENEQRDFNPIPPGRYYAEVYECEERETGPGGKLPEGTPMIWVHFRITGKVGEDEGPTEDSEYWNRRVFRNLIVPPRELDGKAYKSYKMFNGAIVAFFKGLGYPEDEVIGGGFEPDLDEQVEKALIIQVSRKKDEKAASGFKNEVEAFISLDSVDAGEKSGLL